MTKHLDNLHPDSATIPEWFKQHGYTAPSTSKVLGGCGKESDFKKLSVPDQRTGGKTKDEFAMPGVWELPPNLAKDPLREKPVHFGLAVFTPAPRNHPLKAQLSNR